MHHHVTLWDSILFWQSIIYSIMFDYATLNVNKSQYMLKIIYCSNFFNAIEWLKITPRIAVYYIAFAGAVSLL